MNTALSHSRKWDAQQAYRFRSITDTSAESKTTSNLEHTSCCCIIFERMILSVAVMKRCGYGQSKCSHGLSVLLGSHHFSLTCPTNTDAKSSTNTYMNARRRAVFSSSASAKCDNFLRSLQAKNK